MPFEKATKVCEISNVDLTCTMVEISQNFVAFSEYMNLKQMIFSELTEKTQQLLGLWGCCSQEMKQKKK